MKMIGAFVSIAPWRVHPAARRLSKANARTIERRSIELRRYASIIDDNHSTKRSGARSDRSVGRLASSTSSIVYRRSMPARAVAAHLRERPFCVGDVLCVLRVRSGRHEPRKRLPRLGGMPRAEGEQSEI